MDPTFIKIIIALALGAAIGFERQVYTNTQGEKTETNGLLGVRSFTILTLIGCITGIVALQYKEVAIFVGLCALGLLLIHYWFHSVATKNYGITTELAAVISFVIGLCTGMNILPTQVIIAITVILILILSNKVTLYNFVDGINNKELAGFVSYALIALVILPFLPNVGYTLNDFATIKNVLTALNIYISPFWLNLEIINPFRLWFIVVIITGIDVLGHVLERIFGSKNSLLASSLIGGFISSTGTTVGLVKNSKEHPQSASSFVGAALLANTSSFVSTFLVISTISPLFLLKALPLFLSLIISSSMLGLYFLFIKKTPEVTQEQKTGPIFSLGPALTFATMFMAIRLISRMATAIFGANGFLLVSAFAGVSGIDAATINIAENLNQGTLGVELALTAFTVVNIVNLLAKVLYAKSLASRQFTSIFAICIIVVIACMASTLLFIR
jgi:uncharacterized membrane protein (DUF4010 family)